MPIDQAVIEKPLEYINILKNGKIFKYINNFYKFLKFINNLKLLNFANF